MEGALIEVLAALGQGKHQDDLKHSGWNGKHIGVEDGELEVPKREGEVGLYWGLWYVCDLEE
jgi:hypothetical protein